MEAALGYSLGRLNGQMFHVEHLVSSKSMATLPLRTMMRLLEPYAGQVDDALAEKLGIYLDLLIKWNARTNLTAIRQLEEIVTRHFGESLFTGLHLPPAATLLDFGSGAGFPGLPIQLLMPHLRVTLAESQNKKASFLREAVRVLGLTTEVWADRVEALPQGRQFDIVTLRAVDNMPAAILAAAPRAAHTLAVLTTAQTTHSEAPSFVFGEPIGVPASTGQCLLLASRQNVADVPRGTSLAPT